MEIVQEHLLGILPLQIYIYLGPDQAELPGRYIYYTL